MSTISAIWWRGLRGAAWWIGLPARVVILGAIRLYRVGLSGSFGSQCRFHPSCSEYAQRAVRARGATVGTALILWRLARCNPFGRGGVDEPPTPVSAVVSPRSWTVGRGGAPRVYDDIIPSQEGAA